jgi:hypothetical protein
MQWLLRAGIGDSPWNVVLKSWEAKGKEKGQTRRE